MTFNAYLCGNTVAAADMLIEAGFIFDEKYLRWVHPYPNLQPAKDNIMAMTQLDKVRATIFNQESKRLAWWYDFGQYKYCKADDLRIMLEVHQRKLTGRRVIPTFRDVTNREMLRIIQRIRNEAEINGEDISAITAVMDRPSRSPLQDVAARAAEMGIGADLATSLAESIARRRAQAVEAAQREVQGTFVGVAGGGNGGFVVHGGSGGGGRIIDSMPQMDLGDVPLADPSEIPNEVVEPIMNETLGDYLRRKNYHTPDDFTADQGSPRECTIKLKRSVAYRYGCSKKIRGYIVARCVKTIEVNGELRRTQCYHFIGHNVVEHSEACLRCGRANTSPLSVEVGYGPDCCRHLGVPTNSFNFDYINGTQRLATAIRSRNVNIWLPIGQFANVDYTNQ